MTPSLSFKPIYSMPSTPVIVPNTSVERTKKTCNSNSPKFMGVDKASMSLKDETDHSFWNSLKTSFTKPFSLLDTIFTKHPTISSIVGAILVMWLAWELKDDTASKLKRLTLAWANKLPGSNLYTGYRSQARADGWKLYKKSLEEPWPLKNGERISLERLTLDDIEAAPQWTFPRTHNQLRIEQKNLAPLEGRISPSEPIVTNSTGMATIWQDHYKEQAPGTQLGDLRDRMEDEERKKVLQIFENEKQHTYKALQAWDKGDDSELQQYLLSYYLTQYGVG